MELKTIGTKVRRLFDGGEDRGVSPVIGVILMVAITVILAAVIGAFVLGLGEGLGSGASPTATFSTTDEPAADGSITFTHNNGDSMEASNLYVLINGERVNVSTGQNEAGEAVAGVASIDASDNIGAGSEITINFEDASGTNTPVALVEEGDSVALVFDDGDASSRLTTHTATGDLGAVAE